MYAWQHVQLTGTNRSFGLILNQIKRSAKQDGLAYSLYAVFREPRSLTIQRSRIRKESPTLCVPETSPVRCKGHTKRFGGHRAVVPPDPIPNSAVKHSIADGSGSRGSVRVGSRHSFPKPGLHPRPGFFVPRPLFGLVNREPGQLNAGRFRGGTPGNRS